MKYNVYDFDKTIYDGDSTVDFYRMCVKKNPLVLLVLPKACLFFLKYKLNACSKTRFKEVFYEFLRFVPDVDKTILEFWNKNRIKCKKWYLSCRQDNDIIISASPEFLLEPICKELKVGLLLASRVDKRTGKTNGINCCGSEKVRRLKEVMPRIEIAKFYSDSYSDMPLAKLADESFLVRKDKIFKLESLREFSKV